MIELNLWQEIILYIIVLIDLFIFIKLSQIKVHGKTLVKLHWRLLIALIFPLLFVLVIMFGAILLALALVLIFILFFILKKKKYSFKIRLF